MWHLRVCPRSDSPTQQQQAEGASRDGLDTSSHTSPLLTGDSGAFGVLASLRPLSPPPPSLLDDAAATVASSRSAAMQSQHHLHPRAHSPTFSFKRGIARATLVSTAAAAAGVDGGGPTQMLTRVGGSSVPHTPPPAAARPHVPAASGASAFAAPPLTLPPPHTVSHSDAERRSSGPSSPGAAAAAGAGAGLREPESEVEVDLPVLLKYYSRVSDTDAFDAAQMSLRCEYNIFRHIKTQQQQQQQRENNRSLGSSVSPDFSYSSSSSSRASPPGSSASGGTSYSGSSGGANTGRGGVPQSAPIFTWSPLTFSAAAPSASPTPRSHLHASLLVDSGGVYAPIALVNMEGRGTLTRISTASVTEREPAAAAEAVSPATTVISSHAPTASTDSPASSSMMIAAAAAPASHSTAASSAASAPSFFSSSLSESSSNEPLALVMLDIGGHTLAAYTRWHRLLAPTTAVASAGSAAAFSTAAQPVAAGGVAVSASPCVSPLSASVAGPLLCSFLECAMSLTEQLGRLHALGISYQALRPDCVLYNDNTRVCQLIDFSAASLLYQEDAGWRRSGILDVQPAQWPYMSAEQTGRMNRLVDHRSDQYSLGVLLFELLTGATPFQLPAPAHSSSAPQQEAIQWIHAHLARQPHFHYRRPAVGVSSSERVVWQVLELVQQIVLKLLEKASEDRYHSENGLMSDLHYCRQQLISSGVASAGGSSGSEATAPPLPPLSSFRIGLTDSHGVFAISQQLYGREDATRRLYAAYQRVVDRADEGRPQLLLVSGFSGVGKSSLVDCVHRPMVSSSSGRHGLYCVAKWDMYRRSSSELFQAFHALMTHCLTSDVMAWRARILAAVGVHGQLLCDVIPALRLVIGEQPDVPVLPAPEATALFNRVFASFVRVFASVDHPLVLFVDDLQWADDLSLSLIRLLFNEENLALLIIGACRVNEVSAQHPLTRLMEQLRETAVMERQQAQGSQPIVPVVSSSAFSTGVTPGTAAAAVSPPDQLRVETLSLQPLSSSDITSLVCDTLFVTRAQAEDLGRLLHRQTGGNPFFLVTLLTSYHAQGALHFNYRSGQWEWELTNLRLGGVQNLDSVLALLQHQVAQLPPRQQSVLQHAACIGSSFSLVTLALVSELDLQSMAAALWALVQRGLVLPVASAAEVFRLATDSHAVAALITARTKQKRDDAARVTDTAASAEAPDIAFKFLHDAVQQASSQLVVAGSRDAIHLKIARLLYAECAGSAASLASSVVEITDQFNFALALVTEPDELLLIVRLNSMASTKATQSVAYAQAQIYAQMALQALQRHADCTQRDVWAIDHDLAFATYRQAAEAYCLAGDASQASTLIQQVIAAAAAAHHREHHIDALLLSSEIYSDQAPLAISALLECLRLMDVQLVQIDGPEMQHNQQCNTGELLAAPAVSDPHIRRAQQTLARLVGPLYVSGQPGLLMRAIHTSVWLAWQHGTSIHVSVGIAIWASLFDAREPDVIARMMEVGRTAMSLLSTYQQTAEASTSIYVRTGLIVIALVQVWHTPVRQLVEPVLSIHADAIRCGELEYAGYTAWWIGVFSLNRGQPLHDLQQVLLSVLANLSKKRLHRLHIYAQYVLSLVQKMLLVRSFDEPFQLHDGSQVTCVSEEELIEERMISAKMYAFELLLYQMQAHFYARNFAAAALLSRRITQLRDAANNIISLACECFFTALTLMQTIDVDRSDVARWMEEDDESDDHDLFSATRDVASASSQSAKRARVGDAAAVQSMQSIADDVLQCCRRLKAWSVHGRANYHGRCLMVEAEWKRLQVLVQGRTDLICSAQRSYERACAHAIQEDMIQDAALANELCGRFLVSIGRTASAMQYLHAAAAQYSRWQCTLKIHQLRDYIDTLQQADVSGSSMPSELSSVHSSCGSSSGGASAANAGGTVDTDSTSRRKHRGINLDMATVMQAAQTFSVEVDTTLLLQKLMRIVLTHAGANSGSLLIPYDAGMHSVGSSTHAHASPPVASGMAPLSQWRVGLTMVLSSAGSAQSHTADDAELESADQLQSESSQAASIVAHTPADISAVMPISIFHYVCATRSSLLLSQEEISRGPFRADAYFKTHSPRSCLCAPIVRHGNLSGMLYLENDFASATFSREHVELLQLLCSQAALSLENATLYQSMRQAKEAAETGMRSKSQFLTNMSHEIRTPLNAVIGLSRLLADTELNSEQSQCVSLITNAGQLLLSIVNDVLDLSRLESGKLVLECAPFSLLDCVETSVHLCWSMAHLKKLDLAYTIDANTPDALLGDCTHLQQVLVNLISNGIKFTHAKGNDQDHVTVLVSLHNETDAGSHAGATAPAAHSGASTPASSPTPPPVLPAESSSVLLRFQISDSGIGVSEENAPKLFQIFTQAEASTVRRFGGSGLGLVICKRLVEAMATEFAAAATAPTAAPGLTSNAHALATSKYIEEGRIWLESEEGAGSQFYFTVRVRLAPATPNLQPQDIVTDAAADVMQAPPPATEAVTAGAEATAGASVPLPSSSTLSLPELSLLTRRYRLSAPDLAVLCGRRVLIICRQPATSAALSALCRTMHMHVTQVRSRREAYSTLHGENAKTAAERTDICMYDVSHCRTNTVVSRLLALFNGAGSGTAAGVSGRGSDSRAVASPPRVTLVMMPLVDASASGSHAHASLSANGTPTVPARHRGGDVGSSSSSSSTVSQAAVSSPGALPPGSSSASAAADSSLLEDSISSSDSSPKHESAQKSAPQPTVAQQLPLEAQTVLLKLHKPYKQSSLLHMLSQALQQADKNQREGGQQQQQLSAQVHAPLPDPLSSGSAVVAPSSVSSSGVASVGHVVPFEPTLPSSHTAGSRPGLIRVSSAVGEPEPDRDRDDQPLLDSNRTTPIAGALSHQRQDSTLLSPVAWFQARDVSAHMQMQRGNTGDTDSPNTLKRRERQQIAASGFESPLLRSRVLGASAALNRGSPSPAASSSRALSAGGSTSSSGSSGAGTSSIASRPALHRGLSDGHGSSGGSGMADGVVVGHLGLRASSTSASSSSSSSPSVGPSVARGLSAASPSSSSSSGASVPGAVPVSLRILIVDDNLINQKMMQMMLTRMGYKRLTVAINGQEAIDKVQQGWQEEEQQLAAASSAASSSSVVAGDSPLPSASLRSGGSFDLVILDITMDVMDGLEASRRIRAMQPAHAIRPFILAHTADSSAEMRAACALHCDAFLAKPFRMEALTAFIHMATAHKHKQMAEAVRASQQQQQQRSNTTPAQQS